MPDDSSTRDICLFPSLGIGSSKKSPKSPIPPRRLSYYHGITTRQQSPQVTDSGCGHQCESALTRVRLGTSRACVDRVATTSLCRCAQMGPHPDALGRHERASDLSRRAAAGRAAINAPPTHFLPLPYHRRRAFFFFFSFLDHALYLSFPAPTCRPRTATLPQPASHTPPTSPRLPLHLRGTALRWAGPGALTLCL